MRVVSSDDWVNAAGACVVDVSPSEAFQTLVVSSRLLASGRARAVYPGGAVARGAMTDGLLEGGTYRGRALAGRVTVSGMVSRASF